jgi:DNA polymerase I
MSVFERKVTGLPKPNYEYITTEEDARQAINIISQYPMLEVDSEATALNTYEAKISLLQIGIPNKSFVFDVRNDTEHSNIDPQIFKPVLTGNNQLRLLQNAVYDMKLIKHRWGFYIENIYDTMLTEQLFYLGQKMKANLQALVFRYLGITMDKEPQGTFENYGQTFQPFQLEYAANDVSVLRLIRDLQLPTVQKHNFEDVCRLEFEFTKSMCEMELNGIILDAEKQRRLIREMEIERDKCGKEVSVLLDGNEDQTTLFGVTLVNPDSPLQLKNALNKYGLNLEGTAVSVLEKHMGLPVIDSLLAYRKAQKFISTYGEALIERINPITGRLHTDFTQMVSTGRMSSSDPNLQNIPKKQKYRSAFVARDGYSLITADMSGAELRILGNMSLDKIFIECFRDGIDLHTRTIAEIKGIPMSEVTSEMRNAAKAINFGLAYGLSKFGLARRLKITEKAAEEMMNKYFERYSGVKKYLNQSAREAVRNRYSMSISGRKRFYTLPEYNHPDYRRIEAEVKRRGMNQPIQGGNADTIKQAMIYLVDRLEKSGKDAKLILTVHDEVVVEARNDHVEAVKPIVEQSLIDGFGRYFSVIPMETEGLVGDCWLKDPCENKVDGKKKCGGAELRFDKEGTLKCLKCGGSI